MFRTSSIGVAAGHSYAIVKPALIFIGLVHGLTVTMTLASFAPSASGIACAQAAQVETLPLSVGFFLSRLALLDDVALGEEDGLQLLAPHRRATQQEFEVHSEMFEFFLLRIFHDRARIGIGF